MLLAWAGTGYAAGWGNPRSSSSAGVFTGKITSISKGSEMEPGRNESFYVVKLDSKPNAEFRLSPEQAVKYGVVAAAGNSAVVTPKDSKGLGWKVRLTCQGRPEGSLTAPVYQVKSLERINN